MQLEKGESVLGSLYTLRGGLSAISVDYDKAQSADDKCYAELEDIAELVEVKLDAHLFDDDDDDTVVKYVEFVGGEGIKAALKSGCDREVSKIEYKIGSIKENEIVEKRITDTSPRFACELDERKRSYKYWLIAMSACLSILILCLSLLLNLILSKDATKGSGIAVLIIFIVGISIVSIMVICATVGAFKDYKNAKTKLEGCLSDVRRQREEEAERVSRERSAETQRVALEIKAAEDELNAIRDKYEERFKKLPEIQEMARKSLCARNEAILPLVEGCNLFYRALKEQYSYMLDERDWQHLDLVIYQLETRRADSVKEALQLVDRELQTERLENTIMVAMKSICFTLQSGFTAIQDSITENCAQMSSALAAISRNIAIQNLQFSKFKGGVEDINKHLESLTDSINIGNALQAKANKTSEELIDDVHALRYYNTDMYI